MKKSLTAAFVESVKRPKTGQVEYFDSSHPGLMLRVGYGGRKAWSMVYRVKGDPKLRRHQLGIYPVLNLAQAREAWREVRKQLLLGNAPVAAAQHQAVSDHVEHVDTFASVCEEWLRRDQESKKSYDKVKRTVRRYLISAWGPRPITSIGKRDAIELIDSVIDKGAPVMARSVHAHAHRLFTWAVGRDIVQVNPLASLEMPSAAPSRDRVLTDAELVKVWNASERLGGAFGPATQLLFLTGARREEIGALRWSEIDGDMIELSGERTKNGEPHLIALSSPARALLDQVPRIEGCDFVFSTDGKRPIKGWDSAKRKLDAASGVGGWVVHDIRRTVATNLQKLGTPLTVTEACLGHTSGSRAGIVKVYQRHDFADEKRMALEAWAARVLDLVHGRATGKVVPMKRA